MANYVNRAKEAGKATAQYVVENPGKTALYVASATAFLVPGAVLTPVLGAVGFGAAGPVAGSIAAGAQTANTAAGSLFALAQSAAMGGSGAATLGYVTQSAAVGAALIPGAGAAIVRGGGGALAKGAKALG